MADREKTRKKTAKEKLEEITSGLEPIVGEGPSVTIEGRTYKLRRLGIQDTFRISKIVSIGLATMTKQVDVNEMAEQSLGLAMIAAVPYAENEILDLLADIVGVSREDIRNSELFPMGSELAIIEALTQHQDLLAFFTQLQRLWKVNPQIQQIVQQASPSGQ